MKTWKKMNETLKTKNWMESIELTVHLKSAARECNFNGKTKCQVTRRTNWKQSRELIWFSQEKKAKIEEKQKQDSSRLGKSTIKFPAETKAQGTERVSYIFFLLFLELWGCATFLGNKRPPRSWNAHFCLWMNSFHLTWESIKLASYEWIAWRVHQSWRHWWCSASNLI